MKINKFTTTQLVEELKGRPETEILWSNTRDSDEFYFGDVDQYVEGKAVVLIVKGEKK